MAAKTGFKAPEAWLEALEAWFEALEAWFEVLEVWLDTAGWNKGIKGIKGGLKTSTILDAS